MGLAWKGLVVGVAAGFGCLKKWDYTTVSSPTLFVKKSSVLSAQIKG